MTEPSTGLSVTPPAGYAADLQPAKTKPSIRARKIDARDVHCSISYDPSSFPDNKKYDPNVRNLHARYRTIFERVDKPVTILLLIKQGDLGNEDFVPIRRSSSKVSRWLTLSVLLRTRNGYVSVNCTSKSEELEDRRPEFETIVRSISISN